MKTLRKISALIAVLFCIATCKKADNTCLMTVDIRVIDVDADTKHLVADATNAIGIPTLLWDGHSFSDTFTVHRGSGQGMHTVRLTDETDCETFDSINVFFDAPSRVRVDSIVVTDWPALSAGFFDWDEDNNPDLRLSINSGYNYNRNEYLSAQTYADQSVATIRFYHCGEYDNLDTTRLVSLWDENIQLDSNDESDPEWMEGLTFHFDGYLDYPNSFQVAEVGRISCTFYVTWLD